MNWSEKLHDWVATWISFLPLTLLELIKSKLLKRILFVPFALLTCCTILISLPIIGITLFIVLSVDLFNDIL